MPRALSCKAWLSLTCDDVSTVIVPKATPVTTEIASVKSIPMVLTPIAPPLIPSTAVGNSITASFVAHQARREPMIPAAQVSNRLSVRNCSKRRLRPAPKALRMEISLRRETALAKSRFPTLRQAMSSTKPTAPKSANTASRESPRSCRRKGVRFVVQPRRWIVERTFGWLGRSRRLSKEYERTTESSEAFIKVAMIHLMVRRLRR